jgi:hypothetical protein
MSFIVSFKTDNFVIMAGDKRETYVDGSGYIDGTRKVHKVNNYIYGTTGSTELGKIFDKLNSSHDIIGFIKYADEFYNNVLQKSKLQNKEHWTQQKFSLTLQIAGIVNANTYLSLYNINFSDDGILKGVIPLTKNIPCFVLPDDRLNNYIDNYIKMNHPNTIDEATTIIDYLMKIVSDDSIEVSKDYDIEFIETKNTSHH